MKKIFNKVMISLGYMDYKYDWDMSELKVDLSIIAIGVSVISFMLWLK